MVEDIYDPLDEYINVFRDKFKKDSEETFEESDYMVDGSLCCAMVARDWWSIGHLGTT